MRITNNRQISFQKVYIEQSAFDRAMNLARYYKTSDEYAKAKDELVNASEGKDVYLAPWDDYGVCAYSIDDKGEKTLITRDSDFIQGLKKATEALLKKQEPKAPKHKPFKGTMA